MNDSNHFSTIAGRFTRWALGVAFCLSLVVLNAHPAAAISSSPSKPSDGVVQLDKIEESAKQVLKEAPRGLDKATSSSTDGLNGVQGKADAGKMNTPANSQAATTVTQQIKSALENLKG